LFGRRIEVRVGYQQNCGESYWMIKARNHCSFALIVRLNVGAVHDKIMTNFSGKTEDIFMLHVTKISRLKIAHCRLLLADLQLIASIA